MNVSEYNVLAEQKGVKPEYRGAAISVHGMNTRGAWQKDIQTALQDALIRYRSVDYGTVFTGVLRRKTALIVAGQIRAAYEDHFRVGLEPGAIAHSFGTLSVGRCLQNFPDVSLRRIVLFGSILRPDFPWDHVRDNGQVEMVLNEKSRSDFWVKVARFAIPDAGPSGVKGFHPPRSFIIEKEHPWTEHSGLGYELHCRKTWVPFLLGGSLS